MTIPTVNRVWQFADAAGDWKVSLARDAMTIETTAYHSRSDLMSRWVTLLQALEVEFRPVLVERIGVRFIDRIVGEEFSVFPSLMNIDLVSKSITMFRGNVKYSLNEALLTVEEGELLLRWGMMPPHMSPDPSAIALLETESFLLDIDVWSLGRTAFEASCPFEGFPETRRTRIFGLPIRGDRRVPQQYTGPSHERGNIVSDIVIDLDRGVWSYFGMPSPKSVDPWNSSSIP